MNAGNSLPEMHTKRHWGARCRQALFQRPTVACRLRAGCGGKMAALKPANRVYVWERCAQAAGEGSNAPALLKNAKACRRRALQRAEGSRVFALAGCLCKCWQRKRGQACKSKSFLNMDFCLYY
jgi:hypothetical protein